MGMLISATADLIYILIDSLNTEHTAMKMMGKPKITREIVKWE